MIGGRAKIAISLLLVVAVFCVLLLAAGLSQTEVSKEWELFRQEEEDERGGPIASMADLLSRMPEIPGSILQLLTLSLMVLVPIVLVFSLFSEELRRGLIKDLKRALVILLWMFALMLLFQQLRGILDKNRLGAGSETVEVVPDWINNPPLLVTLTIGITLITLLVVAGWFVWRRFFHRSTADRIAKEAQATVEELRAGRDFENAIINCYARMCQVLQEEWRIVRGRGMTPTEFAKRLEDVGLAGVYVTRLTKLFEKVRYGAFTFDQADEADAIDCLTAIVEAVETPVVRPLGVSPS